MGTELNAKAIEIVKDFKGVPETMLLTGYAKALDNRSMNPILGDALADQVVSQLEKIRPIKVSKEDILGTAFRAKQFDEWVKTFIYRHPNAIVLNLACGIDARIYRVNPPPTASWFDYDFPQTIELRRLIFPERAGDAYQMIPQSVTADGWLDAVPFAQDRPVCLIAEGLFMYLSKKEVETTLGQVLGHAPSGEIIFDAVNSLGARLGHYHPAIRAAGAKFDWGIDQPQSLEMLDPRLKFVTQATLADTPAMAQQSRRIRMAWSMFDRIPYIRSMIQFLKYKF
ncbi:MAG: class I SAM-dependent methyltransferase [Anaerolineae bacterium]